MTFNDFCAGLDKVTDLDVVPPLPTPSKFNESFFKPAPNWERMLPLVRRFAAEVGLTPEEAERRFADPGPQPKGT